MTRKETQKSIEWVLVALILSAIEVAETAGQAEEDGMTGSDFRVKGEAATRPNPKRRARAMKREVSEKIRRETRQIAPLRTVLAIIPRESLEAARKKRVSASFG